MIDKENEVFTRVYERVVAQFPAVAMDASYQTVPSGFPHVSLRCVRLYEGNQGPHCT